MERVVRACGSLVEAIEYSGPGSRDRALSLGHCKRMRKVAYIGHQAISPVLARYCAALGSICTWRG
jgi:hypothetical protein